MSCRVAVLSIVLLLPRSSFAQPQEPPQACAGVMPANVDAHLLSGELLALLRRSETFRAQCSRIAAEPRLRVTLDLVNTLDSGRAQTTFRRCGSGTLVAEILVVFGENYRELLAHEFEHVLEQIEHVDLRREAAVGRAWQLAGGAFETRRAFVTGVQVLREAQGRHVQVAAAVIPAR
jgi:hypothetical protein